jgi:2-polyprenyl-6-methoxyphenol hydroxylase-like FAD-dependent oxidoreductase
MRAVVCGAGIAGLTLGWWLGQEGWDVLLVERAKGLREAGYMIDFFGSGYDVADLMGLVPRLREVGYRMGEVVTVDGRGRRLVSVNYDVFAGLLGGRLLDLLRGDLERTLFEVRPKRVEPRYGTTITDIRQTPRRVDVTLSDGRTESADILIGADGIHSHVRKLVFGEEERFLKYLGYHTAAFVLEDPVCTEVLHGGTQLIAVPGRHAGLYPIRGGKVATFFVHREVEARLSEAPCVELRRVYGEFGGIVPTVLEHCDKATDVYADIVAQIEMPTWTNGRVTLIGDACSAVSLVAGQGASIAMGSAYVLARSLCVHHTIEEALGRYEARVKPVVRRKQMSGRRTAEWLFPTTQWRLAVRNLAVGLGTMPGMRWLLRPVFAAGKESLVHPDDRPFDDLKSRKRAVKRDAA